MTLFETRLGGFYLPIAREELAATSMQNDEAASQVCRASVNRVIP